RVSCTRANCLLLICVGLVTDWREAALERSVRLDNFSCDYNALAARVLIVPLAADPTFPAPFSKRAGVSLIIKNGHIAINVAVFYVFLYLSGSYNGIGKCLLSII